MHHILHNYVTIHYMLRGHMYSLEFTGDIDLVKGAYIFSLVFQIVEENKNGLYEYVFRKSEREVTHL